MIRAPRNHSADEQQSRRTAAAYLRAARKAECPDDALESASWAQCLAPDGVAAIRIAIRLLIHLNMTDEADALIARGLLLRPDDPTLLEMQANSYLRLDRLRQAKATIARVIAVRPQRRSARHTAAQVAIRRNRPTEAVTHLESILRSAPDDVSTTRWLVDILLDAGHIDAAQERVNRMRESDPLLRARVMRRRGRVRDALDLLERSISVPCEEERCGLELVDLIEASGDQHSFARLYDELVSISDTVRRRAMEAGIRFGQSRNLAKELEPADSPAEALIALIAGSGMLEHDSAHDLLDRVRTDCTIDDEHVARLWRAAMTADHVGLMTTTKSEQSVRCDHGPLTMLLRSALDSLKEHARTDPAAARHCAEIAIALGEPIETVPQPQQSSRVDETVTRTDQSQPQQAESRDPPLRRAA